MAQKKQQRRHRPGTAAYTKGQATAASILDVAKTIVIKDGMAQLTMRRIARELDMSPGNLSYYYASKSDLLEDLCTAVLAPYLEEFERLRRLEAESPAAQLRAVLEFVFDDLSNRDTTHFFPELWVLALHDDWAQIQMETIYSTYRSVLIEIISAMRPDLAARIIEDLALTISASIEGHTVFIGHERRHAARASAVKSLIIEQLVELAANATGPSETRRCGPLEPIGENES